MIIRFIIIGFILVFISFFSGGCYSGELTKYADDKNCSTTIEGIYYNETSSTIPPPNIFLKMPKYPKLLKGELISIDSMGVIFDPDNIGFTDYGPTFYPYDTLYGVIDTSGKLIYGSIPDYFAIKHTLMLGFERSDTREIVRLILQPNEPFAYCIDTGSYKITEINFVTKNKIEEIGYDLPDITIEIVPGSVNYLGNIYLDYKSKEEENVLVIPYSRYDSNKSAAIGVMFGLVGTVVNAIATELENDGLYHVINFERDKTFLPESNKPIKEISLIVKKRK